MAQISPGDYRTNTSFACADVTDHVQRVSRRQSQKPGGDSRARTVKRTLMMGSNHQVNLNNNLNNNNNFVTASLSRGPNDNNAHRPKASVSSHADLSSLPHSHPHPISHSHSNSHPHRDSHRNKTPLDDNVDASTPARTTHPHGSDLPGGASQRQNMTPTSGVMPVSFSQVRLLGIYVEKDSRPTTRYRKYMIYNI